MPNTGSFGGSRFINADLPPRLTHYGQFGPEIGYARTTPIDKTALRIDKDAGNRSILNIYSPRTEAHVFDNGFGKLECYLIILRRGFYVITNLRLRGWLNLFHRDDPVRIQIDLYCFAFCDRDTAMREPRAIEYPDRQRLRRQLRE